MNLADQCLCSIDLPGFSFYHIRRGSRRGDRISVKGDERVGASERRAEIMRILCRRRHETVSRLAEEFGVSTRTIQRDIVTLSLSEPIYTLCGRYEGGVYVTEGYVKDRMYMTESEIAVLRKLASFAESRSECLLAPEEFSELAGIISLYTKPKSGKERR